MKNLARLFFLFVFLFFLPQRVEADISSISATAVITSCPQLLSGSDRCEADLYAMTTDGSTETFNATYGIDFRTGSPPGVTTYLWNASPYNTGTITVGPTSQYLGSFYTMVNNGTGTCALSEGQVYARPRIDQVCTLCFTPDSYGITNIGAMVHIHVNTSTGANAGGALVSFSPSDYSEGSRYADSNGNAYAFQNLNCSIGHTVSASWNGETGSIWLPAQSGSDPSTLCNGTSRTFTINLNPATPPPGAPSAGGSTIAYCPSAGSSTGNMDVYWSGGSGATSHRINYGVGCDAHNDACPNDVTLTVSPQTINGFSLGNTYNWEIFACNAGGCTPTAGGYYTRTFPSSCAGPTATPTPTTPPASTCVGAGKTCGTASSPATGSACTTSGGAAGTWQWDGQPSSSSCFTNPNIYCYTCVGAAPTSPPPVDPYCPNIDTDGRPNACVNAGSCPPGYSRKPAGDNACTAFVTLDPLCPNTDLDGRSNACQNSCTGGRIAKGGAADAACQSGGLGTFCCHDYAPKWCCHQNAPTSTPAPTPPPATCPNGVCSGGETCSTCPSDCGACATCPNGFCSGGETCSTCPSDCGACPTATPTVTPTPTVFIRGRLMEDTNNDDIPDRYYQNQLVSLSGAAATSGLSTNPVPFSSAYNFNFVGIPAGIYNINFSMPPSYTLVSGSSAKPVSNLNVTSAGNSSTTWTIKPERQCENTPIDDDTDLFVDCNDSMCHCDGKISNPLSCGPTATCPTPIPTATPTVAPPTPTPTNVPGCVSSVGAACGIKCCNNLSCTSGGVCANPTSTPTPTPTNTPTPTVSATPIPQEPGPDTECSDNVDNADPEDTLRDGEDPGCIDENGYWDPNDDNESDKPSCATSSLLPARVDAGYTATAQVLNCVSVTPPFEWTPTPINKGGGSQCSDGSDNDSDSLIDSFDPGCHSDGNPSNPSSYNPKDNDESNSGGPLPECSDGADNDADSFIDFPADPGCTDPNDNNESSIPYPECSDGIDNGDADPLADYLDPECHSDNNPTHQDTYDPNDPSESGGADTCSDASISGVVTAANASSSRATWTAPTCPGNQDLTCPVGVTINGAGGSVDINIGTVTVNPTYNVTARTLLDDGYNNCTGGSSEYSGNVQVSLTRTGPLAQETRTRTMTGSETFYCQISGQNYELAIAPPIGYRGVSASITGGSGSAVSPTQFSFSLASTNPTVTFCITNLAPWYQTDAGDVRFNTIDNPVPPLKSASKNVSSPSLLFSSSGNSDIGLGNASPNGDKEWVIDQEYNYNKNMKSVNGAAAYTFYKSRIKQRNITLNTINNGASGSIAPSSTGIYEITGDSNGNFNLTGYTHPTVSGAPGRVVLLVPGNLTISSNMNVPSGGLLIVAVKGTLTIDESVGDDVADYDSTTSHLDGIFTSEEDILIPGNLCVDGVTPDLKLNIAGSLVANARKPFAEDPTAGIVDNQRSLCQGDADYASLNVATRPDFLLQLTDFYKTTYTRWKEVRP